MASDKDVIGKADALLRRHSTAPGASASDTGGVPVLTDLVGEPPSSEIPESSGDLADEVFARVMAEVEGRLAADLERRLDEHLLPHVQDAVANAIADLRRELADTVRGAVAEALARHPVK